jgi:ribosomal protein L17
MITSTLKRVLTQDEGIRARKIVEALITKAENGDISAIREILDRTEGKILAQNHVTADINNNQPVYVITGIDDKDTIESLDKK